MAVMVLLLHGGVALFASPGVLEGRLVDPDCYAWLMRVERLLRTGDWWDGELPLLNAPAGLMMHWTRAFDLVVLVVSAPMLLLVPEKNALFWGASLTGPVLQLTAALFVFWAARALANGRVALLAVGLFLMQPGVYASFQLGRADHHSLQLTLATAVLACLLVWSTRRASTWLPLVAGLAAAVGLWVGTEALMTIVAAGGALGLAWLFREDRSEVALWRFALGLAGGTLAALAVERPPADWLTAELDRLSIVHVYVAIGLAAAAAVLRWADRPLRLCRSPVRLLFALALGATAMSPTLLVYPGFFAGPYSEVDPQVATLFLAHVKEAQPLVSAGRTTWGEAMFALGPLLLVVPFLVLRASRDRGQRMACLLLFVCILAYLAGSIYQKRVLGHLQMSYVIPWAMATAASGAWFFGRLRRPWRAPIAAWTVLGMMLGPAIAAALLLGPSSREMLEASEQECDWSALSSWLVEEAGADGRTVATNVFAGPEIAWRTGQGVISAPYHRNTSGILAVDELFRASPARAFELASDRELGFVVLCDGAPGTGGHAWYVAQSGPNGLYGLLVEGRPPPWLERVPTPNSRLDGFWLYRVNQQSGLASGTGGDRSAKPAVHEQ